MSDPPRAGRPPSTRDAALALARAQARTLAVIPPAATLAAGLGLSPRSVANALRAAAARGELLYDEQLAVYHLPECDDGAD